MVFLSSIFTFYSNILTAENTSHVATCFFILCLLCLSLGLYAAFRFFKATFPAHYFSDAHYLFTILFLFSALQKSPVVDYKIFNLTYVTTCLSVDVTNVVSVFSISHAQACAP